jgi:hypothetical protein
VLEDDLYKVGLIIQGVIESKKVYSINTLTMGNFARLKEILFPLTYYNIRYCLIMPGEEANNVYYFDSGMNLLYSVYLVD